MTNDDTVDFKMKIFRKFKSLEWDYFESLSDDEKKLLSYNGRLENYNPSHLLEYGEIVATLFYSIRTL
ncbi:hypothetical protein I4U23_016908 [Adineta vaga]|nr:hypothetical protein I4U23_016908 [Adineta vaga]